MSAEHLLSDIRIPEKYIELFLTILFRNTAFAEAQIVKTDGSRPRRVFQSLTSGFGKDLGCTVWIERTGGRWIIAYEPYAGWKKSE